MSQELPTQIIGRPVDHHADYGARNTESGDFFATLRERYTPTNFVAWRAYVGTGSRLARDYRIGVIYMARADWASA